MTESPHDVTMLLALASQGDRDAADRLAERVQAELHRIAVAQLRRERSGHTLQPTALVNEAYMRLIDQQRVSWQNRAHFFAVAATLMRRVLVSYARAHVAGKRGGDFRRVTLSDLEASERPRDVDLLDLDEALNDLALRDPEAARLVDLRYFAGLTVQETAEVLGTSISSVEREWATTRAWLYRHLTQGATP